MDLTPFGFETARRIVVQTGAAARLGAFARELSAGRALVVTDPFLATSGLLAPALDSLKDAQVAFALFDAVVADPPAGVVEACADAARAFEADTVIGVGGGSSLDTAKLAALLAAGEQPLPDLYGVNQARGPRLKLILAPTTAGTGSEVTAVAIVTTETDEKKGVVSPWLFPDVALLDAELTLGLPPAATAMTGIDAMVHAIEAYTSRRLKNPVSDSLAVKALSLLAPAVPRAVTDGADLQARHDALLGACMAGMAFANAPVAAVHALAYPLGGRFHVPHGLSNALVLGEVLEFNLPAAGGLYGELNPTLPGVDPGAGGQAFVAAMRSLVASMPFAQRLSEVGVAKADLPLLAQDALKIERLLINNPRPVTLDDALAIYDRAF